jgi:hypothetical protein
MLWEACVAHGASECFWPRPFRVEATSLMIVMASVAWVSRVTLGLRIFSPQAVLVVNLGFLTTRPDDSTGYGPICHPYLWHLLGGPLLSGLVMTKGRYGDLDPTFYGALHLLQGHSAKDVLQLLIHLFHPTSRGCVSHPKISNFGM